MSMILCLLLVVSPAAAAELPDLANVWNWSDPAASEASFRALLDEHAGDEALQIRTQVARALGLQRKFDEGHAELDAVEAAGSEAPLVRVRVLLELGRLLNSSGDPAASRPVFEAAVDAAEEAGLDFLAVDAAHMVGIVAPAPDGEAWTRRAIEMAAASDDDRARRWRASLLNNLAWTLHDAGRAADALPLFEEAVREREARGKSRGWFIARWSVGRCQRSLGRLGDAWATRQALLVDGHDGGYLQEELGEILLARGQGDLARPHFARAHAELSQDAWLVDNEPARVARLQALAQGGGTPTEPAPDAGANAEPEAAPKPKRGKTGSKGKRTK